MGSSRKEGGQPAEQRDIIGREDIPRLALGQADEETVAAEQGLPDLLGALPPEEVPVPGIQPAGSHQGQGPGGWGLLQQGGQRLHGGTASQVRAMRHPGPDGIFPVGVLAVRHMLLPVLLPSGAVWADPGSIA